MSKITFLIFEKSYLIRKGIVTLIEEFENCEIIFEYNDIENIHSLIKQHKPNAVIINLALFNFIPINLITRIRNELHCAIMAIGPDFESLKSEFIDEYLYYFDDKSELLKRLKHFVDNLKRTESLGKNPGIKKTDHELSEREKGVVILVAKGLTNKEIADTLFISIHTAMTHRKNIARKLGIKTASGITVYAILNKLIDMKDLK